MIALSASKIKKLQDCSWSWYCTYVLKLPRDSNDGARRGTCIHLILELLLKNRHFDHYLAVSTKGLKASPACERLVRKAMKREGLTKEDDFNIINEYIVTGLNEDFFVEGFDLQEPELGFDITEEVIMNEKTGEKSSYRLIGFIDKLGIKDGIAKIVDYKSSKQKLSEKERLFSIQGLCYQIAVKFLFPQVVKSFVNFLFLKFKKNPRVVSSGTQSELEGFKRYLAYLSSEYLVDFDEKKAKSNYGYDNIEKRPLCGSIGVKDDGSPKWVCPHALSRHYYVLLENGKIIKSSYEEDLVPKENQTVEKRWYEGCARFIKYRM